MLYIDLNHLVTLILKKTYCILRVRITFMVWIKASGGMLFQTFSRVCYSNSFVLALSLSVYTRHFHNLQKSFFNLGNLDSKTYAKLFLAFLLRAYLVHFWAFQEHCWTLLSILKIYQALLLVVPWSFSEFLENPHSSIVILISFWSSLGTIGLKSLESCFTQTLSILTGELPSWACLAQLWLACMKCSK